MAIPLPPESERFEPDSLADWHDWLAEHHATATGIWLVGPRRKPPGTDLTYDNQVREALCWGWIDGQVKTLDETRGMQRWTPRNPRSGWSRTNQVRVAELEPTGRIQPAGRAVIEAAKASGMWTLFDDAEDLIESPALAAALDAVPAAGRLGLVPAECAQERLRDDRPGQAAGDQGQTDRSPSSTRQPAARDPDLIGALTTNIRAASIDATIFGIEVLGDICSPRRGGARWPNAYRSVPPRSTSRWRPTC